MSFRDDTEALRHRIEQHERALAGLEGRRRGLELVVAAKADELGTRRRELERRSVAHRSWKFARGVVGLVLGVLGALFMMGGGCILLPVALDSCADADVVRFEAVVASSTRPDVVAGAPCDVRLVREPGDETCEAEASCGGVSLARERGRCLEMAKHAGLTFRTPPERVPRAFVLAEPLSRATVVSSRGEVRLRIRARR